MTGLTPLHQYLEAATARSIFLTPAFSSFDGFSAGLLAPACDRAALATLAHRLRSENPQDWTEALHEIASSPDLSSRIASLLSETDHRMFEVQASRYQEAARGVGLQPLKILFLGDIHDTWGPVRKIVRHECRTGREVVLGVGDLETYKPIPAKIPFLFCHGNHENAEEMAKIRQNPEPEWGNPYPLYAGDLALIRGGLTVGAFSGIYEKEAFEGASTFPFFSRADVARILGIPLSLDIFLSHEGPAGVGLLRDGRDLGSQVVTEVLEKLQPNVAFFGHHHRENFDGHLGRTRVIGLDYPKISYVTAALDAITGELHFERHRSKLIEKGGVKVYQYDWEGDESGRDAGSNTRLFSMAMPTLMSREKEAEEMLNRNYRSELTARLIPVFLPNVGKQDDTERTKQLLAEGLANGIFNTILSYFARYYTSLKATFSERERELLRKSALRQMLEDKPGIAFAHDDLTLAFNELSTLVEQKESPVR